jgi:hypothetical protein
MAKNLHYIQHCNFNKVRFLDSYHAFSKNPTHKYSYYHRETGVCDVEKSIFQFQSSNKYINKLKI